MSEQTWTRAHDALIAERAEGLKVFQCEAGAWWVHTETGHRPLDRYNEDLAASARAQEKWVARKGYYRAYEIEVVGSSIRCECRDWDHDSEVPFRFQCHADTEAAARAWSLWRACGGVE